MALPPLPPGFKLAGGGSPSGAPDPWDELHGLGVEATNGYRTPADLQRLRSQGYKPAPNTLHLNGDAVDLTPGKSGLSMGQLYERANAIAAARGGRALNEGNHVHMQIPGWGKAPGTPGTPNAGIPDLPDGFSLQQRGSLQATGQVHDGDTFRLTNGKNARLFGADAFELNQTGRTAGGVSIPLGTQARELLSSQVGPGSIVTPTGAFTYGRPVASVGSGETDAGANLLRSGLGLAAPEYLKGSPLLSPYMEAERLARLNGLGAHGNTYQAPASFRAGEPDPWQQPTPVAPGEKGTAVFADEPTPFQGLRPEIAAGYLKIWNDPKSKPEDLQAYASENGFTIRPEDVQKAYAKRFKNGDVRDKAVSYFQPPRPVIDPGDGKLGTTLRGFGDPFNILDETGGVADALGLTGGRENVFNSDRRFGDILWNNIDQNRSILAHDDLTHPYYRLGGQLASGIALPIGAGARTVPQLIRLGAIEGGFAGFGAGEGGISERFPNAVMGTALGAAGGGLLGGAIAGGGLVAPKLGRLLRPEGLAARRIREYGEGLGDSAASPPFNVYRPDELKIPPVNRVAEDTPWSGVVRDAAYEAAPVADDGMQAAGPTSAARNQPEGGVVGPGSAAMRVEDNSAELVGPVAPRDRQRDVIDVGNLPPMPPGFRLADTPFGGATRMDERLSPEAMARLAEGVDPSGAIPRPSNQIDSFEEAVKANPGRFQELQAPNPLDELGVRRIGSTRDLFKGTRIRGPFDVTKQVRRWGGVQDQAGELSHLGITNQARRGLPFGGNEQFLGKLINKDGMTLDQLGERLYDEGWLNERPTVAEVVDILHREHLGESLYHPESLNEVAAFEAADAEATRIAKARDEGAPLVDDRGDSINLDDLIANTPPAGAYEEMPRLTGKVGNLNLSRLEKPEEVGALVDQISKRVGGFSASARGRITHDETKRLADELGLTPEQLLKRQQGQALNAEQLYASRALVQRSRETVARLAKKAVGGSEDDLASFRKAWLRHVALEEQIAGATAEAGRALSQLRILANAQDAGAQAVRAYLKGNGGKESLEDAASAIVDLMEDPAKANHFMREAVKPRWRDKFNELWINSLLSGPRTHVVNFVGNMLTTAVSFPEHALTAGIGKLTRSADRAYFGEVSARAVGLADSSVEALKRMKTAFKTGEPIDQITKVEAAQHQAIGGRFGHIIRTPTRALTASDEFWKTLLSSAELRQLAYRQAKREATGKEDFASRYQALLRNPPEGLVKQAQEAARYYTFQKPLGEAGRGVQQVSNNWIGGKIILPFVRTPINLLKFAGERSALALAMPEVRAALRAGGRQRDEALAKITLGSGLSTAAVVGALNGRVSGGGPTDPRERAALLQSGWQPYSFRVGDKWVSYQRFDPVSTLFGVAADFAEVGNWATQKESDQIALDLAQSIAKNVTNKTWLSGLSDAFDVLSDPERYGGNYVEKQVGALAVPSLLNQTAQALDPHMRDARSIVDAIKARVPVLSESVPVRRNVWGDPVERGNAIGPDILSPFYATSVSHDRLSQEVARLRVPLSMPQRFIAVDGKRVDLTPQQYDELVQLTGQPAKQFLEGAIGGAEWRAMNDGERVEFVKDSLKDFREAGRAALLERYPALQGTEDRGEAPLPPMPLGGAPQSSLPPLPPGFALTAPGQR